MKNKDSKSWGHILKLKKFQIGAVCSGPNCLRKPRYELEFKTSVGERSLKYCYEHAFQFAVNNKIRMPRSNPNPHNVYLKEFSDENLIILKERIDQELTERNASSKFFEGITGPQKKPYIAKLYFDKGIKRFFYQLEEKIIDGVLVRQGIYHVSPGVIIEKRTNDLRQIFLINDSFEEELFGFDEAEPGLFWKDLVAYMQGKKKIKDIKKWILTPTTESTF